MRRRRSIVPQTAPVPGKDLELSPKSHGEAGQSPLSPAPETPNPAADVLALACHTLDDMKAEDITVIDLRGKTSLADAMIIASGRVNRHVGAIADSLVEAFKTAGHGTMRVEGQPACDWVLLDGGDIIIHVFRPEVRQFYNLEKMWGADRLEEKQVN